MSLRKTLYHFTVSLARLIHSASIAYVKQTCFAFVLLIALSFPLTATSQESDQDIEEISVFLAVQGIGGCEITAIYKNDEIYLPIYDVFKSLKINQKSTEFSDSISGFFLNENTKYIISQPARTILLNDKLYKLNENELISTETSNLALRLDQYGKIFGLNCSFNFNSLTVELKTTHELPIIKELRVEQMRKNINRLQGEIKVDKNFPRRYHMFRGGMADWAIYSTQVTGGQTETRALLGLGVEFMGGETNLELNYSTKNKFSKDQQQYHWRWANNETKAIKQITLGKINSRTIASVYSPMIGGVITNTPTTFRRSFGTYTMTDFTEPGWTVELYINNVIVDYTTADASGFFQFDIPLVYGSSNVLLKFYGPWGEEREKQQNINIPYNFLPKGEFRYSVAGAMVQDTLFSRYARAEANYGVNRFMTVGGGYEYLSSIKNNPSIPFVQSSVQLFSNVLVNAEYAYGVRIKTLVSYNLPSNFMIDFDWAKYDHEQKAIAFSYLEERKVRLSIPIDIKKIKLYTRFAYSQNIFKESQYSTVETTLSSFYKGVSANFTGFANWSENHESFIYGNLGLGFRFFKTLTFRPQVQYDFSRNAMVFTKVELQNSFSPISNLSLVWENNALYNQNSVELTYRYDLPFAQTTLNTRLSKKEIVTGQSARGSIAFGSGNHKVIADKRTQVGRAGLSIIPYLDVNNNNKREENEPFASGLNIRLNGGRILPEMEDSIIRIVDLEPFASYMLEFSDTQFDNVAWQLPYKTISLLMDPNQFKLLQVPVKVMGEINGMVFMHTSSGQRAQGRILINIYNQKNQFVARAQSEPDGFYSFIGLPPGEYYAKPDSAQLQRLKVVSVPARYDFEIQPSIIGDIIDNVEFKLQKAELTPAPEVVAKAEKTTRPAVSSVPQVGNKAVQELQNAKPVPTDIAKRPSETHRFFVQAGAFEDKENAKNLARELSKLTGEKWFIDFENGLYKVRLGYFASHESASNFRDNLNTPDIFYYISEIRGKSEHNVFDLPEEKAIASVTKTTAKATSQAKPVEIAKAEPAKDKVQPVAQPKTVVENKPATTNQQPEKPKDTKTQTDTKPVVAETKTEKIVTPVKPTIPEKIEKVEKADIIPPAVSTKTEPSQRSGSLTIASDPNGFFVQAGAFKIKQNADELLAELLKISSKKWFIMQENGYYKVRIGYFDTKEEAKEVESGLDIPQMEYYVNGTLAVRKAAKNTNTPSANPKQSSTSTPAPIKPAATPEPSRFYIQAGAVTNKESAESLSEELMRTTLKRWFIVKEGNIYKVRLGYFNTREAARHVADGLSSPGVNFFVGELQQTSKKE